MIQTFYEVLRCSIMVTPFKYLGLPVGGNPTQTTFWELVLSKIRKTLSVWKGKNLSFTGHICLIKSILNVIHLYFLSFFKAPVRICKMITKLQQKFL